MHPSVDARGYVLAAVDCRQCFQDIGVDVLIQEADHAVGKDDVCSSEMVGRHQSWRVDVTLSFQVDADWLLIDARISWFCPDDVKAGRFDNSKCVRGSVGDILTCCLLDPI